MKNKFSGVIAVVLCMLLALSCFTACSLKKGGGEDTSETLAPDERWQEGEDGYYRTVEITGVELAGIVSDALGEESKSFSGDLKSLSAEQVEKVKQTAEKKGYKVESDDSGNVVIKKEEVPVTEAPSEVYSEILSEAEVTNVTKLSEEEYKKVSKVSEEKGVTAVTDDKGDLEIVSKVPYSAPPTSAQATSGNAQGTSAAGQSATSSGRGGSDATSYTQGSASTTGRGGQTSASTSKPVATTTTAPTTTKKNNNKTTQTTAAPNVSGIKSDFVNSFGGSDTVVFTSCAPVSDGVIAVGNSFVDGSGKKTAECCGIIAKFGSNGKIQWKNIKKCNDSVFFKDVAVLSDGSLVVVGDTMATDAADQSEYKCSGTYETIISCYSPSGSLKWTKVFGGSAEDSAAAISATPDGGFVITGDSFSHDGDLQNAVSYDGFIYVAKYSGSGSRGWVYTAGGTKDSSAADVDANSKGEVFVAVQTSAKDGTFAGADSPVNKTRSYVIKLTSGGSLSWKKELYETGRVLATSIVGNDDGGCTVAGNYSSTTDGNLYTFGDYYNGGRAGTLDAFIMALDSGSHKRWLLPLIGYENDYISSITAVPGGYAVCGYTESTNRDFVSTNLGDSDCYVYVVSQYGKAQTYTTFGGSDADRAMGICSNGYSLYTVGTSTSGDYAFSSCDYKGAEEKNIGFAVKYTLS